MKNKKKQVGEYLLFQNSSHLIKHKHIISEV